MPGKVRYNELSEYQKKKYLGDFYSMVALLKDRGEVKSFFKDLRNDPNALIISNKVLNRDNQYFSTEGLELVDQYKNILIYKFQN